MSNEDARDLVRHVMMFGPGAVCRKMGGRWFVDWRGVGFPTAFRTRTEAMNRVRDWMEALRGMA